MNKLVALIIILSVFGKPACGQSPLEKQRKVAENYLSLILKGQKEETWQLFDKSNVPAVTEEQFVAAFSQIKKGLAIIDTFTLSSIFSQEVNHRILNQYSFKVLSKTQNFLTDLFIDLIFFDTSGLVGGMKLRSKPKDSTSLTSKGKETPIEKKFTAVIDAVSYNIRGINIVHFDNNIALLAIQVERNISPDEFEKQGWTKKEAIKFAKFLVAKNYFDKAKLKAKELGLNLVDDLGVSFINPGAENGINIKLTPEEFH